MGISNGSGSKTEDRDREAREAVGVGGNFLGRV